MIERIRKAIGNEDGVVVEMMLAGRRIFGAATALRLKPDYDDAWLYALASRHANIMDVGANRGFTALLASLAGGSQDRRLLLVDANPTALGVACRNLTMNGFGKGIVFQSGVVADAVGKEVEFYTIGAGDAGSIYRSHARSAARKQKSCKLTTTTIDAIAAAHEFVPDLVKMDVEGAELDALKGAVNVAKSDAVFFIEMHALDSRPMVEAARSVIEWSRKNGRTAYYMKRHVQLSDPEMIAHRGRCHLLILKSDHAYPDYLRSIPQSANVPN